MNSRFRRAMLTRCFREIQPHPDTDHAQKVMPLLQEALQRTPRNKNNRRYVAVVYRIMGERQKAIDVYRDLLKRHHDIYLYAELPHEPGARAALLCQAIMNQRQEKFRTGYRLQLARLLIDRDKPKAAHKLHKCILKGISQLQKWQLQGNSFHLSRWGL